jgi:hypothetical protein
MGRDRLAQKRHAVGKTSAVVQRTGQFDQSFRLASLGKPVHAGLFQVSRSDQVQNAALIRFGEFLGFAGDEHPQDEHRSAPLGECRVGERLQFGGELSGLVAFAPIKARERFGEQEFAGRRFFGGPD